MNKHVSDLIKQEIISLITIFIFCIAAIIIYVIVDDIYNAVFDPVGIISEPINDQVNDQVNNQDNATDTIFESINAVFTSSKEIPAEMVENLCVIAANRYESKMLELECEEIDKEKWFLEYKQMLSDYDQILDMPETVYDVFSEEEVYLIQRAVETEVFQCDFESKTNVASVIFNRIYDGRFGSTVKAVITNPGQFAYHRTKISESTKLAVEYAFEIEDTTNGCIAFRSDRKPDKWGNWYYSFSDNAVHHFYLERKE